MSRGDQRERRFRAGEAVTDESPKWRLPDGIGTRPATPEDIAKLTDEQRALLLMTGKEPHVLVHQGRDVAIATDPPSPRRWELRDDGFRLLGWDEMAGIPDRVFSDDVIHGAILPKGEFERARDAGELERLSARSELGTASWRFKNGNQIVFGPDDGGEYRSHSDAFLSDGTELAGDDGALLDNPDHPLAQPGPFSNEPVMFGPTKAMHRAREIHRRIRAQMDRDAEWLNMHGAAQLEKLARELGIDLYAPEPSADDYEALGYPETGVFVCKGVLEGATMMISGVLGLMREWAAPFEATDKEKP